MACITMLLSSSAAFLVSPQIGNRPAAMPSGRFREIAMVDSRTIPSKNVWTDLVPASECLPGTITSGYKYGQEIAICSTGKGLYAISNKLPPTGQPATFGKLEKFEGKDVVVEPLTSTAFDLKTGKHVGPWCPSTIGRFLIRFLVSPETVPTYPVRKNGESVQALINVNLKAQFEQKYWRGVLDSQGKVDGGYY